MSGIIAAVVGSAIIAGGATIYASNKASAASKQASEAATAASKDGLTTEWNMYQQNREDYAPWRETGTRALGTLEKMTAAGPGEFDPKKMPGYEFGFKNFIEKPYLSQQSASGKRLSGQTVKGLTKYAGDYAETAYDNFLNRYYQKLTPFQSLAGTGMTATTNLSNTSTGIAGNIAGIQQNIGGIQAQNLANQGNISGQMAAGIGGSAQQGINSYMNFLMLKKMGVIPSSTTSASTPTATSSGSGLYEY